MKKVTELLVIYFIILNNFKTILICFISDLLANIMKEYSLLSLDEKEELINKKEERVENFFKKFNKELNKGKYELDIFIQIINIYQNTFDETGAILINTINFNSDDLVSAILRTLTKANSKKFLLRINQNSY